MINHVKGIVCEKNPVYVILETMGLGFELKIPLSTFEQLPLIGEACQLYSYLHISQDDVKLYGFHTKAERELFIMLIGVSGIGPKIALSALSTFSISAFVKAIQHGDEAMISKVPGIGKKSAMRLVLELKDDVIKLVDHIDSSDYIVTDYRAEEVENALESLGFNSKEIRKEIGMLPAELFDLPLQQIIKETIKRIYQKRK